ncbi:MAG: vWA domain-containing protein [Flavobacteriales bacterium]|jgi:Ca-activated chloride channel family protein
MIERLRIFYPIVNNIRLGLLLLGVVPFFNCSALAQIAANPARIAFGDVTKESDKVVDIIITNNTSMSDFLLRSDFSNEFEVKFSTKTLDAGGQLVVRIQFNPRAKGKFSEVAKLYFASMSEPIQIPISANVLYVNVNGNTPCPDFSTRAADCCASNFFLVEVYDKATGKPINEADFRLEEDGYIQLKLKTNSEGKVSREVRIGFYDLIVSKKGYKRESKQSYVNNVNSRFIFYLERDEDFVEPEVEVTQEPNEEVVIVRDTSAFSVDQFKPNNVVFLLDISGSMGVGDKLSLMKISLTELLGILRPVDRVAIVSYANEAKVIQPTATGTSKESIIMAVNELKTGGKTSGAKGFKKSYSMLKKSKIESGNNQLIVITDGAFAVEDQKSIRKLVKKAAKAGYTTSIVGIKPNAFAKENLSLVTIDGNGSFLQVENPDTAKAILIEEVKKNSAK